MLKSDPYNLKEVDNEDDSNDDQEKVSLKLRNDGSEGVQTVKWNFFGAKVPKNEIVYLCQIILLYIVICISITNLTLEKGDKNTWLVLLSSCLGYILPNPKLEMK